MAIIKYDVQVKAVLATQNLYKIIKLDIDDEIVNMCHGNRERLTRALDVFVRPYFARYSTLKEIKIISCVKSK